jgi:hypothetical protein
MPMFKEIIIDQDDIRDVVAMCEYLEDEQEDFERACEERGIEYTSLLNEHELGLVPDDLKTHIYFISRRIWSNLSDVLECNPHEIKRWAK